MSLSLSPLSVFALNPTVAVQLLSQSLVRHGMWLRRLTECLRCAQCTDAALTDVAGSPFMSAARWVATSAGERVCGDAGSDLDNLSALGIVLTPATHADLRGQDVEFLHRIGYVLALNSDTALQHQHWLRSFLSNAPSRGGVSLASAERLHEAPLFGTVFARLILDADPGSAMVVGDVRQLLSWVRGSTSSAAFPTAAVTSEELLRRFTPEGQVELLLAAADAKEQKWSRVCGLVEAIQPTPGGIVKMIAWCHRRCQLTRGGAQHVAAVLQFYGIASGVPTESTLSNIDHRSAYAQLAVRCATCQFPLLPLDSSPSAAVFSSWLAAAFLEAIRSILFRDTPHGLAHPTLDNFTRACVFVEASATPSSHRRAMEAIHAQIVVDASSKWVHSVLWAVEPLASAVLTTADADILLCMSSHLESPGPTQRRFSAAVKDNIGTVSCLALALIGRVEFVRATMLVALGARHGMWGGRIRVETPQCHRFLDPHHIDGGDRITPAYAVSFLPRVLPSEVVATVLRKSTFSWDAPQLDALPYNVSCGLSPELVGTNLAYLRQLYGSYPDASTLVPSYQSASIPSHAFIGLKMVVLWFKCFGVDSDGIVGLCRLPGDADKRAFRSFLELRSDDSLGLPREMPPLVVDVTLLRSPSTRMMQLGTAVGRTYTREALTVALPSLVGEDWGFLSDGDASAAAVIDGIAAISAARYAASCNELRTNAPPHAQDFVTMYANEMLQPCFELLRAGMAGHAVRYCRTAASEAVVTCSDRGALALAALSRRNLELVEAVVGGDRPIPLSVRDEIAYFVRGCDALEQRDQRDELLRLLQDVTTEDTSPAQQSPCAVALHQIVESVQVMPTPSGVEFPLEALRPRVEATAAEVPRGASIFGEPPCVHNAAYATAAAVSSVATPCGDISNLGVADVALRQFMGRSVDVSHILRLECDKSEEASSVYFPLLVTPGAGCYLVEVDGNLGMSANVVKGCTSRVLRMFKSHGEAWAFCKACCGPISLIGRGFFLYRSKVGADGLRFYTWRSTNKPESNRFHVWHIVAYHSALCLKLPPPLKALMTIVCEVVFAEWTTGAVISPRAALASERLAAAGSGGAMPVIVSSLLACTGDDYESVKRAAMLLMAYVRLLLRAAQRMRDGGDWLLHLNRVLSEAPTNIAAPAVGTVSDVLVAVLTRVLHPETPVAENGAAAATLAKHLQEEADDVNLIRNNREMFGRMLANPLVRTGGLLPCIRGLSSSADNALALDSLSEAPRCSQLQHLVQAMTPLPLDDAETMLMKWHQSVHRRS